MSDGVDRWWSELVAVGLIGTARRTPPSLPQLGIASRTGSSTDTALLDQAAIGSWLRLAGRGLGPGCPLASAPADHQSLVPDRAAQLLELALLQPPAGAKLQDLLVAHWLSVAERQGGRVPHQLLPTLLDYGARVPNVQALIRSVSGDRGRWLADHNPAWAAMAEAETTDTTGTDNWDTMGAEQRLTLLDVLRRCEPNQARTLIEATWQSDPAAARAQHLATLQIGLGREDEALLEAALDDRAKGVREVAQRLLAELPGSVFAHRMEMRLRPLVTAGGLIRKTVTVALPDATDDTAVRDGLGEGPRHRSQRGWRLERIVAASRLALWEELTGLDPDHVVARLDNTDVIAGLQVAAVRQRDPEWARALLRHHTHESSLLDIFDDAERERFVVDWLKKETDPIVVVSLIERLPQPCSEPTARAVIDAIVEDPRRAMTLGHNLTTFARILPPEAVEVLRRATARDQLTVQVTTALSNLIQFLTATTSINEAFS